MGSSNDGGDLLPPPPPPSSTDELSTFLRQILSSPPLTTQHSSYTVNQPQQQPPKRIVSSAEMFDRSFPSVSGEAVSPAAAYAFENKRNRAKQRQSLKRNIDAEFHNLSEKRRRSKINEKMKALQKLIPNSSKTDKASMLDEAIEYLKQLQLQVQTLAVMNGFGLNPMRLPPVLPPTQTRINKNYEQEMNLETLRAGGSHSLAHCGPPETSQEMCFSAATML